MACSLLFLHSPPFAVRATKAQEVTGMPPVRTMRPLYVDRLPPCNHGCPAGENIQAWLAEAQAGRYRQAWDIVVRDNPMPAVHGRVCYHPCEDACNRKDVDEAVSIHAVERFLGDMALDEGWTVARDQPPSHRRVLIVGAGPSGLSAAWHLSRRGHEVVIHEAGPMAGGMMHFGIPKYRLPREVLDGEIERIRRLGVEIVLNHKVTDLMAERIAGRFDAVFLAVGAHLSKRQEIPARDAGKVYDALQFLREVETSGAAPRIGRRVAIYGGGNTAMDAARTAARVGASPDSRPDAGARLRGRRGDRRGRQDPLAPHDQRDRWDDAPRRGDAARREPLSGADRRDRDARSRFRDPRARPGD
jgi:NADPH-dependent glutamate synthase beta subunit-like oxidoreductase